METTKLGLAATMGRIAGLKAWESVRRERPTTATAIPPSAPGLTPEWLTAVLCAGRPGAAVTGVELLGGSNGTTSRRALRLEYNAAGREAGLPERVFTKATPSLTSRLVAGPSQAISSEVAFYNAIRPGLEVEAPTPYYAAVDERSYRSMLLLEDVCVTRGARFGSALDLAVDRPKAESMLRQMAAYHAAFWLSPRFGTDLRWVDTAERWQANVNRMLPFERRSLIGFDRAEAVLPAELLPRRAELYPNLMRSLASNAAAPETLLHSDTHLGNWYVTESGAMGQHDWQCITKGQWALDVSYALSCALRIEDRRAWEHDLIALYLEGLAKAGLPGEQVPALDDAFLAYRRQMFHALFFWLFTIGRGPLQPKMQPDEISRANLARMGQAVVDLESLDAW